jgi:hypothetical protein
MMANKWTIKVWKVSPSLPSRKYKENHKETPKLTH